MLPIRKQHQSNAVRGHIYLTITFAVLIFMIKTIRHLWVACARALRLTTIVKRAAIRGFTRTPVSSVCSTAQPVMEMPLHLVISWEVVMQTLSLKPVLQRIIGSVHIVLSFSFPLLLPCTLLSLKKAYLWWTPLCSTHHRLDSSVLTLLSWRTV